jgi:SAM-dependent methyltransferase
MITDPIYVFRRTWGTYQKVISNNLMFHREISAAIRNLLSSRPGPLNILDLGCGDAAHVVKLFSPGQIGEYIGCDLSPYALDVARINLEPLGKPVRLLCRDMLAVLREAPGNHFDVVYSSYALHHLPVEEKQAYFTECHRTLRKNGCVILVDVMREEGQSRPDYLDAYNGKEVSRWEALTPQERDQVQEHISNCDFPETPSDLEAMSRNAGFTNSRRLEKQTWHEAWCYQA